MHIRHSMSLKNADPESNTFHIQQIQIPHFNDSATESKSNPATDLVSIFNYSLYSEVRT